MSLKPIEAHPIENCPEFEFKCPLMMENLIVIDEKAKMLYCGECKNVVTVVDTVEQLEWEVAQGHCVSFYQPEPLDSEFEQILDINGEIPKFKCVVVGDAGVGKTTIIRRFHQEMGESLRGKANMTPIGDGHVSITYFAENGTVTEMEIYEPNLTASDIADTYKIPLVLPDSLDLEEAGFSNDPTELKKQRDEICEYEKNRRKSRVDLLGIHPDEVNLFMVCFAVDDMESYQSALKKVNLNIYPSLCIDCILTGFVVVTNIGMVWWGIGKICACGIEE